MARDVLKVLLDPKAAGSIPPDLKATGSVSPNPKDAVSVSLDLGFRLA